MAEHDDISRETSQQPDRSSWLAGAATAVYHALFKDGALGRAGTQGLDELGQSLIALPGSIHATERDAHPSGSHSTPLVGVWAEQERGSDGAASLYGRSTVESIVHGHDQPAVGVWADANREDATRTVQVAENPTFWRDKLREERQQGEGGSDQNELEKARILPVEQKEQREREDNSRGR